MVVHVSACASSLRFPTRIWSSHLMIFVRLIRSGLRLPFSVLLRSPTERSFSFSCEKQTGRLDHLPGPGLSCGSLLTGRWFVRLPSDDQYMTPHAESRLGENSKLSTGRSVTGGKLLPIWWIKLHFVLSGEIFENIVRWSGPSFGRGWWKGRTFGPIPAPRSGGGGGNRDCNCLS